MLIEWIERQRERPLHERRMVALAVAFTVTGVVAGFYIAAFKFSSDQKPVETTASFTRTNPFSSLVESISNSIESFSKSK